MILYTDIDPFCCQWMENLIDEGQLPAGIVFRFDIREINPICLEEIDQAHFFAGIGGWAHALELAGWPRNWPVWTGSCPCQPWSIAGRGRGKNDERHLWPDWFRLIRKRKPPVIFGEQVASPAGRAWLDIVSTDLESAGYAVGSANLCACGVGAPHLRQRLYWVAVSCQQRFEGIRLQLPKGKSTGEMPKARGRGETVDGVGDAANWQWRLREPYQSCEPTGSVGGRGVSGSAMEHALGVRPEGASEFDISETGAWRSTRRPGASAIPLGNPDERRIQRHAGSIPETTREVQPRSVGDPVVHPSPISGFWSDAEWLVGRDGKLRPAEPGSFPLAHGLPRGMGRLRPWERKLADVAGADVRSLKEAGRNRVGRLRGYGNAIVPQLAAEFVRAVMEMLS